MGAQAFVCRCEDITLQELSRLLEDGVETMEEIKRLSRCTMGPCQGRTCRELVAREIARFKHIELSAVDVPTYRAPTKPVKLGLLVGAKRNA